MATFRYEFSAMGCPCAVHLEHADDEVARRAAIAAQTEVRRLDAKYSHYRDDSLVGDIARAAERGEPWVADAETAHLLDFCAALFEQSEGRFDVTAGALTRLWDLQAGIVPAPAAIEAALARTGWQRLEWKRPVLHIATPGLRLDLGGVVKEYAADKAAEACRAAGAVHGVVDLGGDLALVGPHADGRPWQVGIKDPRRPALPVADIALARGGLATSGDYERAMVVDGQRYSHIVDVRSGVPVESFASVSVLAESCLVAGAISTLGMLFGLERGYAWLSGLGVPFLCVDANGCRSGSIA